MAFSNFQKPKLNRKTTRKFLKTSIKKIEAVDKLQFNNNYRVVLLKKILFLSL